MPLTKKQKISLVDESSKKLKESSTAIIIGFTGVLVESLKKLRRDLKKNEADFKVIKKRLLNIALKNSGLDFNTMSSKLQIGAVFAKNDLNSVAPIISKFSKELKKAKQGSFEVMGAFNISDKVFVDAAEFNFIASLPSREVLLAQIAMMLTMPIKKVMFGLNERAKQVQ